jgi:micrococcal nuclease
MKIIKPHEIKIFILTFVVAITGSGCSKEAIEGAAEATSYRSIPLSENWSVVKVADGDTITIRSGGKTKKIRFCGIDAPETKHGLQPGQPLGNEARDKLRSLVALAKNQVSIIPVESDRYGRTVAEVMANVSGPWGQEMSFQEELLKGGFAYYYKQYASNCPNHSAFAKAEEIAIASRAGVWGQPGLEKPWDYRKRMREK